MRSPLARFFDAIETIDAPATLDGGDVCDADDRLYIGISHRTNAAGAEQLARIAARLGKRPVVIDVRGVPAALHLKSSMAYAGDGRFVVTEAMLPLLSIPPARVIRVLPGEEYGANCVRVNDVVLIPAGHPQLRNALDLAGYETVSLDISEFRKMDGGLSCLSLRF
jgi:dimethylargininase